VRWYCLFEFIQSNFIATLNNKTQGTAERELRQKFGEQLVDTPLPLSKVLAECAAMKEALKFDSRSELDPAN
jgi:cellulose biosynthesis protein BcsQ